MKPYLYSALVALLSSSAMAYDVKSGGKTSVKKTALTRILFLLPTCR
ncbi:hypothetical protein PWW31_14155 [Vibrio harveyi]|nr:hypothetical protein PWW31_14155 [Vibrio harveyi]